MIGGASGWTVLSVIVVVDSICHREGYEMYDSLLDSSLYVHF